MQAYLGLNKASKGFNFSFPTLKLIFSTEMKLHGNKAARSTLIMSIRKAFVYSKYSSCNGSIFINFDIASKLLEALGMIMDSANCLSRVF